MQRAAVRWLVAGLVLVVLATAGPASARNGIFVGGSVGRTSLSIDRFDLDLDQFDFSASDTSYKILAGYRFMGYFAVEASYVDFGTLSDSTDTIEGTLGVEADLKGYDAFAVGLLPIAMVDVFAKVGLVSWDADIRTALGSISELGSDSGTDLVYGLGVQVRFAGLAVRGEVEYFDIADADSLYLVSVGATYTF
jgi:OOP family OmpA-OmpF porin